MPAQSIDHTDRQLRRAKDLANQTLAAPAQEQLALKALATDFLAVNAPFEAAHAAVKAGERASAKEVAEALEALAPLAKFYDEARVAVMAKVAGTDFGASTSYKTPDDFLVAAEGLEVVLVEHQAEPWATPILARLAPLVDAGIKEQHEASDALKALQKLQTTRAQAAGVARPVFVTFRQAVRTTFGRASRQYRELADRRGAAAPDDVEPPAPAPTPVTPA